MLAVVGHRVRNSACNGFSVCHMDPDTGDLTPVGRDLEHLQVGYQFVSKDGILYAVDEIPGKNGVTGGNVAAVKFDAATGELRLLGEARTLFVNPTAVCVDKSGRFAVVTHHGDMASVNSLLVRDDGTYDSVKCYDTCPALLYELREDGSFGALCDVWTAPDRSIRSHLHIARESTEGGVIVITDKGRGKLYSFRIDRENKKLQFLAQAQDLPGSSPRYGVFHPARNLFYQNSETSTQVNVWHCDEVSGAMTLLASEEMYPEGSPLHGPHSVGPSDIVIDAGGRYVFVAVRTANELVSLRVEDDGTLALIGRVSCGGEMPRGLCLSPDGRWLYVCNGDGSVVKFAVEANGLLRCCGCAAELAGPGNMIILP